MSEYDVVIIGSGPAGLTAGLYLSRAKHKVVVLEKESFGGPIMNYECIENYPGFADGVPGAQLASQMIDQAVKYSMKLKLAEVTGIESYSSNLWVQCAQGGYSTAVVIIAAGAIPRNLGVPGEETFHGKGVFNCALCDGSEFADKVVLVCGGGDAGVTNALYMTNIASKVILVEALSKLTATAILQERARSNPKLEIRCGVKVVAIRGDNKVEAIDYSETEGEGKSTLKVDGVLVHIGVTPNTSFLNGTIPLDGVGRILVNSNMETQVHNILAAGDIRSGTPNQVITAAGDGATAAISALKLLQKIV